MFAAFALCLVGAQGMLPSLHQAQVSHRVCAEHGELIEATDSHAGESEHAAPASQDVAIRGVAEGEHDSHCGCMLGAFFSGSEARRGDTLEELEARTALAIEISAADSVVATEILSFAPKQSPPVRGAARLS